MDLEQSLSRLAQAYRILGNSGHGDGTLGHISLRDPGGRGFWLKRAEIGMDEVDSPADFLLVSFDGQVLEGRGGLHSEYPIHAEIFRAAPHLHSVVHTHARNSALLSASDCTISPLTPDGGYFALTPVRTMSPPSGQIDTRELGAELAAFLAGDPIVLLRNHGIVAVGTSVPAATLAALYVERAAAVQVTALLAGTAFRPASQNETHSRARMFFSEKFIEENFAYYARTLARARFQAAS